MLAAMGSGVMATGSASNIPSANRFSQDGLWWWTGESWMPSRSPDGAYARWDGFRWMIPSQSPMRWAWVMIGSVCLWFVEAVWVVIGVTVLVFQTNTEWYARGRVGTEDILATSISVPVLVSFLIVPLIITAVDARLISWRWWLAAVIGGGPVLVLAAGSLFSPSLGTLAMVLIAAAFVGVAWGVAKLSPTWRVSRDGAWWTDGRRRLSVATPDGQWRWDGKTWSRSMSQ